MKQFLLESAIYRDKMPCLKQCNHNPVTFLFAQTALNSQTALNAQIAQVRMAQTHSTQTLPVLGKVMSTVRAGDKRGQCAHPHVGGGAKLLLKLSIQPAARL